MRKLTIKNIGAIKSVELDLNRINVFIGHQSSGKSTISKILCHCMWVEKDCFLDDRRQEYYLKQGVFYDTLVEYHRLDGYFNRNASIVYSGDYFAITYKHNSKKLEIKIKESVKYRYPKISYMPSERNLVAAISNFGKYNEGNDVVLYFGYDWEDAKNDIQQFNMNRILDREIVYEYLNDNDYIFDGKNKIQLKNASSGVLSLVPLYLLVHYMCDKLYEKERTLSPNKRTAKNDILNRLTELGFHIGLDSFKQSNHKKNYGLLKLLSNNIESPYIKEVGSFAKKDINFIADSINNISIDIERIFEYKYTQLFIEEPEQNLFPKAQMRFVNELFLELDSHLTAHHAVITTHSPYILFEINNCIMRYLVKDNISDEMKSELLDNKATINPKDISIYQIENGELKRIQDEDGNLDENFINDAYKANSAEYFSLLNFYENEE